MDKMVDYGWMEMNNDGCKLRDLDEMDEHGLRRKCCFEKVIKELKIMKIVKEHGKMSQDITPLVVSS